MKSAWLILPSMLVVACGNGSPSSTASGGASSTATGAGTTSATGATTTSTASGAGPCNAGAVVSLPACTASASTSVAVPSGCTPTVDGSFHAGEWSDAACVTVGTDPVYVKVSGDNLYLAWAMTPTCGCPAQIAFNTDGASALDGKQIDLDIFDDPAANGGDAGESKSMTGSWAMPGSVASGIKIGNPAANGTMTETYEIAIPLSQLSITPGQPGTLGLALSHNMNGVWPSGLTTTGGLQPDNPANWGKLTSATNWK